MKDNGVVEKQMSPRIKALVLSAIAVACLVPVALFGWYQFRSRATHPINKVKNHTTPISGKTIDSTIPGFLRDEGVAVAEEGFKPSWGAEEIENDVWVVSYVFEVGRKATWISWEVDMESGSVTPRDELASELWDGK